jgi:hypothetical protein
MRSFAYLGLKGTTHIVLSLEVFSLRIGQRGLLELFLEFLGDFKRVLFGTTLEEKTLMDWKV